MSHKSGVQKRQAKGIRSYIFDALMLLLDQKPYDKITVSDIAKKTGIARQTFYRNYNKKNDIIVQYLSKSFGIEFLPPDGGGSGLVFTFDLGYIISHKDNFMKIALKINIKNLFSFRFQEWANDLIDQYKDKLSAEEYVVYRYRAYYQMVGSMYILADWLEHDMPLSVEKLSSLLNSFMLPDSVQYKQVPNIIIRLKKDESTPAMAKRKMASGTKLKSL